MDKIKAEALIEKYKNGQLSTNEKYLLEEWYSKIEENSNLELTSEELLKNFDSIWNEIEFKTSPSKKKSVREPKSILIWKYIAAIAAILIAIVSITLYYNSKISKTPVNDYRKIAKTIKPGRNRATLTLSNGQTIILDSVNNGKLLEQAGITITKTADGQLIYSSTGNHTSMGVPLINTITTPVGGQYQIGLPDGSHVWLNAQSSLSYPSVFDQTERVVTLTGEAYFEIAKNSKQKGFKVITKNQKLEVVGTHFNINAYQDEVSSKTTLIEGSVKVSRVLPATSLEQSTLLKPGQQSTVTGNQLSVKTVNPEQFIAWKSGSFVFEDANLKTVMKTLSRWYDINVIYEGKITNQEFSGELDRKLNFDQILDILSFYKVHFKMEGKNLIVSANPN